MPDNQLNGIRISSIDYNFRSPELYTINRCGANRVESDFYITRNNSYSYYVFHLVTNGSGILIINGQEYILKKNDLFIIEPKQAHVYATNQHDPLGLMWVEFDGNNCKELFSSLISSNMHVVNIDNDKEIYSDFVDIITYISTTPKANPFKSSYLLYKLICDLLDFLLLDLDTRKPHPKWLQSSLNYISDNCYDKILVSDLASIVGYSTEHFSRSFSKKMGMSVAQYIMLFKIEKSINMLQDKSNTIKYISEQLSFTDSTHFIKSFKNILGITPHQYRKFF